jgi:hypothetical protein
MAWCDPCAADPLSPEELQKSGVFWLDGADVERFKSLQNPTMLGPPGVKGLGVAPLPVMLTRLHVRYTPRTFPEDLMFIQTDDQRNWQARYIVQNPYGGSLAGCSEKVGMMDCDTMCNARVPDVRAALSKRPVGQPPIASEEADKDKIPSVTVWAFAYPLGPYIGKSPQALQDDCVAACRTSKAKGLDAATHYYQQALPERIAAEKQTLARLTGWSLHDIDAIPGAQTFSVTSPEGYSTWRSAGAPVIQPWWRKLFSK